MSEVHRIDLGSPAVLEFRGPDAVRFLNGQVTQDVRRLPGTGISLPSCVTDAKGRLQFRVDLTEGLDGALWVVGQAEWAEALEARLTRYLIADDVEVMDLTGKYQWVHFTGAVADVPGGVIARESSRFGLAGVDWWIPKDLEVAFPAGISALAADALEALRISNGVPAWGRELLEGMLPPEARLDETDISYHKGCFVGQEVISRIKSAGKVNKRLARFTLAADIPAEVGPLVDAAGAASGQLTSISPQAKGILREALGFVKRGAVEFFFKDEDGVLHPVSLV
jgi:folate-binding protein YgfZ